MEKGYERLEIYKLSRELAIEIHKMSLSLPKFEMYEEGSQVRRSSKSVPTNIVEGYCLRRHKNEYLQYLHRAFGSCEEMLLHLGVLFETKSLADRRVHDDLAEKYDHLGKMLFRFIESVSSDHMPPAYVKDQTIEYES